MFPMNDHFNDYINYMCLLTFEQLEKKHLFCVKYCETVNHFYYKWVEAEDHDEADEIANDSWDDWQEDHHTSLESRELVEVVREDEEEVY
tara:strand:+ start:207 stop:476 length:270 start_codon:yes stop_codon:yes gene_type:complete